MESGRQNFHSFGSNSCFTKKSISTVTIFKKNYSAAHQVFSINLLVHRTQIHILYWSKTFHGHMPLLILS